MGVSDHYRQHTAAALAFLLFASVITLSRFGSGFQEREGSKKRSGSGVLDRFIAQKRLSGPGSSPPSCRSKCGNCSPCKPVHVPIQPGFSMPLEYYPEAWRCKCGNKLFMP
ncbi:EPIDERMAL PATTERNING FACTOR-like protein 5 [Gossypium australe]|uniref:Epidermal patterning factor-like protein n=1 Tax=Gossypium australe TaxID=47621 RepID=A0A5B6WGT0_9ROSI|nr:EPIDERMAL PATTERNING FACTOR-like protein 5 [Gossypium australe]